MLNKRFGLASSLALLVPVLLFGGTTARSEANTRPEWLQVANRYRASAGLAEVTEHPDASRGAAAHSRYLVTNGVIAHTEERGRPDFSEAGLRAGLTGNVSGGSGPLLSGREAVEGWLTAPFHGVGMLAPTSTRFGYGTSSDAKRNSWASTLSLFWDDYVADGRDPSGPLEALAAELVAREPSVAETGYVWNCLGSWCVLVAGNRVFATENGQLVEKPGADPTAAAEGRLGWDRAVVWPGPDTGVPLVRYSGNEYPDPLTGCPGYRAPVGLPIYILRGRPTEIADASLVNDSAANLKLCVITAGTYRNARDAEAARAGTDVLESYGAAVLLPREPLRYGHAYSVRARTTDGESYAWTFRVTTTGAVDLPAGHPAANERTVGSPSQPMPTVKPTTTRVAPTRPTPTGPTTARPTTTGPTTTRPNVAKATPTGPAAG